MLPCSELVNWSVPALNTNRMGKEALCKVPVLVSYSFKNNTFPVELDPQSIAFYY